MSALTFYGVPGKMTRRLLGVVIGTQGLAVFFGALVAWGLASAEGSQRSGTFLLIGSVLAVLCILDAGLLRRRWGITLGWVLQIATLGWTLIVPAMLIVGLLFGALWLTALVQGAKMDEHTRLVDQRWHAAQESADLQPSAQQPAAQEPSTQEPSTQEPSTQEPAGQQPAGPSPKDG